VFEGYTILKLGMFKGCPNLSIVKHPAQTDEQFISQEITYQNKKFIALIVALSANQIECVIPNNITMIGGSAFIKNKYSKILIPGNVVGLYDSLSTINADIIEFTGTVPTTLGVNYLTNE
jgi:hypothetical protein